MPQYCMPPLGYRSNGSGCCGSNNSCGVGCGGSSCCGQSNTCCPTLPCCCPIGPTGPVGPVGALL